MDITDAPERPGIVPEMTLQCMVDRFDDFFSHGASNVQRQARSEEVAGVLAHLRQHTRRRRGDAVVQEGFLEWDQTSRIYELFSLQLNIFERIFFTIDVSESSSVLSKVCSTFLVFMILVSILVWMVSTLPDFQKVPAGCQSMEPAVCTPQPAGEFQVIENFCVYVFTVEYLIRLCTVHSVRFPMLDERFVEAVLLGEYTSVAFKRSSTFATKMTCDFTTEGSTSRSLGARAKLKLQGPLQTLVKQMLLSPFNLVDLLAILPYWIEEISGRKDANGGALIILRILRLTRIFRVFKLGKYNEVFTLFSRVINQSLPALSLMLFFICLDCCLFGTLIWFAEQGVWYPQGHPKLVELAIIDRGAYLRHDGSQDPNAMVESPFVSIIHSFWYVIVTITTVGYGDAYPTTGLGKFIGSVTILNGIIVLAMPIGVVGANFSTEYYRVLDEKKHRARQREKNKIISAVEREQDALAVATSELGAPVPAAPAELYKVDTARQRILVAADNLDKSWRDKLPAVMYSQLVFGLRIFISELLEVNSQKPCGKPVVSTLRLAELDVLTQQVHSSMSTMMGTEDLADFSIQEADACRRQWASFVDRCWEYVVEVCHVQKPPEPPQFVEMKATLVRSPKKEETLEPKLCRTDSRSPVPAPPPNPHPKAPPMLNDENVLPDAHVPLPGANPTPLATASPDSVEKADCPMLSSARLSLRCLNEGH